MTSSGTGGAATDVPLGPLQIDGTSSNLTAAISFNLAHDIPPGEYWITVCNDPCTTGIGDLIGGVIYVGVDPPPLEEEVTSIATDDISLSAASIAVVDRGSGVSKYQSLGPYPSRSSGLSAVWIAISVALASAVLLAALATRHKAEKR